MSEPDAPSTEPEAPAAAPEDRQQAEISPEEWSEAAALLVSLLREGGGVVSSMALRAALEKRGFRNARALVLRLKYFDFDSPPGDGLPRPEMRWYSHARSVYSEEAYQRLQTEREAEATSAERQEAERPDTELEEEEAPTPATERRRNRQEEGRLGAYVRSALENIYQSEATPEECDWVFDVHNDRPGNEYENVDLIAVHWRSERVVEVATVEVKLDFTARLVQQAKNYARFSDRVWIAVPVLAEAADVSAALREFDPLLFEHVIEAGIGILACRRRPGRSYEVIPVQWPRKMQVDPIEREIFIERYRAHFEDAGVVAPRAGKQYPSLW